MKKTKKALATLAIAGMTLSMIPFNAFAATTTTRIAGMTAEQTAVKIADQTGYTGTAILASSTSYGMVDALTAGPLAASLKAPILLTGAGNTLNADTKAELTKLAVKKVYVTSGTAVIKAGVIDELKAMGIEVVALGGFDRAETSVNIAKQMTGVTKVAVANGVPDALSIASVASAANQPILLTNKDALPASVSAYLATAGVTSTDVIGGTGVISDAVVAGLPGATRHFGMTAYDTNNQVIQDFASALEFDNVYVANGQTGIDALAGAPLAAQTKSAIVLTDGKSVPAVAAFTYGKSPVGAVVTALGGEAVVPESVRMGVAAGKVTTAPGELAIVSVSALNDANSVLQITFSKPVSALDRGDITIQNAKTLARYGVEAVSLLSGGTMAEVRLYETVEGNQVLQSNTQYNVTVVANGETLKGIFNRPAWVEMAITAVSSEDKEITVAGVDLEIKDAKFDYQDALGRTARVWFNSDKEVVNIIYNEQVVKYDAIEVTKANQIKLLTEDKKYDVADEDFLIIDEDGDYINDTAVVDGDTVLVSEIDLGVAAVGTQYNFAKIVFNDNGDVEFVSTNHFPDYLVVSEVEEDIVVGVEGSGEFDAEDAVIVKNGVEISKDQLKAGDIFYFSTTARDGDGLAEVLTNTVTGDIDTVYTDSIVVNGKTYDFLGASDDFGDADYINEDGEVASIDDDEKAEELQAAGEVVLNFDRKGDLVFVGGDTAEVESNSYFGYVEEASDVVAYMQAGKARLDITLIDEEDKTKAYDLVLENLDTISFNDEEYDVDKAPLEAGEVRSLLDDQVVGTDVYDTLDLDGVGAGLDDIGSIDVSNFTGIVKVSTDDDGNVTGLGFYEAPGGIAAITSVESGDKYAGGKLLDNGTIVFELNDDGDEVQKVTKWGDLSGYEVATGFVYFDEDNKAEVIVVTDSDAENVEEVKAYITDVRRNTDGKVERITAFVNGEEVVLAVDKFTSAIAEGDVALLEINEDTDEVTAVLAIDDAGYVLQNLTISTVDVGNRKLTLSDGFTYKLEAGGVVIDATDSSDVEVVPFTDLRDVEADQIVTVVLGANGTLFAKAFIITDVTTGDLAAAALAEALDDVAALTSTDYTAASWLAITTATALPSGTEAQKVAKTTAINTAIGNLVAMIASTITFTDAAPSIPLAGGAYTNVVTGGDGAGALTYTSGTPATATVNATTGEVTPVAGGTTVITVSKAATATHTAVTATYTLIVTP